MAAFWHGLTDWRNNFPENILKSFSLMGALTLHPSYILWQRNNAIECLIYTKYYEL